MLKKLLFIILSLYTTACTSTVVNPQVEQLRTKQLYTMIIKYNPEVSKSEARLLSQTSINYSRTLAKRYNVTTTPRMHNAMVNAGFRDRGLCFQWADDLEGKLDQYGFKTMTILPVAANINKLSEHNAIVVLPRNSNDLSQGVLLDPWRHSGELLFMPIQDDKKYNWGIRRRKIYPRLNNR